MRAGAVGLLMLLMLSACAGASPGSASTGGSPRSATTTGAGVCQPSDEMGRPCASEEEAEEYGGGYRDLVKKECRHYLEQSFQAYKACVRY